ncbi:MAG: hypothetical protein J5486_00990 [Bacteroidaceae bacterium]|nr:hypothetical protein [Bacteroidaceae bacterium]
MTKLDAIERVMLDNGGTASWNIIYENIEKYYPSAKNSTKWQEGIRGVLYRELPNSKRFKKIGLGIFALASYHEEVKPSNNDKIRMHSFIEGICLELGNFDNYLTYTADPSAEYRDNLHLRDFATVKNLPAFSYSEIVREAKNIDVIWLNKKGLAFPKRVIEVVDSVGTLSSAFNRSLQLQNFMTDFYIVAPEKHHEKYLQTINLEIYQAQKERFHFINYDNLIDYYETVSLKNKLESKLFG